MQNKYLKRILRVLFSNLVIRHLSMFVKEMCWLYTALYYIGFIDSSIFMLWETIVCVKFLVSQSDYIS